MTVDTGSIQRLPPLTAAAVSDNSGNATFVFTAIPSTRERWGTLSCPTAPAPAIFSFYFSTDQALSGELVGSWAGPNVWGEVLVPGMYTPLVTAVALAANTNYALKWYGYEGPLGSAELRSPGGVFPQPAGVTRPIVTISNPSGGGLINYAKYHATNLGSPITWTLDWGNFAYVVANQIAAFPATSVSLVTYRMETASNFAPSAFPATIAADAFSAGTIDSAFFTTNNDNPWAVSPRLSFLFDTANPYTLPITIESSAVNIATSPQQILEIWSWSHP